MDDIISLAEKFKNKAELQKYVEKQTQALIAASNKIQQLEQEVAHLQKLLSTYTDVVKIVAPSEQEICEIQIELIKQRAMNVELSFEDTKKLETLVRTLKIIKEKDKAIEVPKKNINLPEADLVNIAKQIENQTS